MPSYKREELYANYDFPSTTITDDFEQVLKIEYVLYDESTNSYCVVIRNAIPNHITQILFEDCVRHCTLQIYNTTFKTYAQPRKNCVFADQGITRQKYSNTEVPTTPWTPMMKELRDYISRDGFVSNAALVNGFLEKDHYIDYHSDKDLRDGRNIVSTVSLGGSRVFSFMRISDGQLMPPVILNNGDLVYFWGGTNANYKHSILKPVHGIDRSVRYSVTFRQIDVI